MECTPSAVNWRPVSKMKKPGMHRLAVLNAIGHGSESGLYFQIRQSRGSAEKMHSAVISHVGTENTRVFREVSMLGADMEKISDRIYGSDNPAKVAIIYDKESRQANIVLLNEKIEKIKSCEDYISSHTSCEIVKVRDFGELGIVEVAQVGDAFDPNCHEAVMHIEDETLGENVRLSLSLLNLKPLTGDNLPQEQRTVLSSGLSTEHSELCAITVSLST